MLMSQISRLRLLGGSLNIRSLPGLRWIDFISANSFAILKSQHAQTLLGQLWLLLNPIALALIYYVLVLVLARRGEPSAEYFMYLVAGVFLFSFSSTAVSTCTTSVTSGGSFILNQQFPRVLLPISAVAAAVRRFIPAMFLLFGFHIVIFGFPGPQILMAIPSFLLVLVLVTGLGLAAATAQVFFRDMTFAVPLIMRVLLYASPVLYRPEMVPENLRTFLEWNPFYWSVAAWSGAFSDPVIIPPASWLVAASWSILAIASGLLLFTRLQNNFAAKL